MEFGPFCSEDGPSFSHMVISMPKGHQKHRYPSEYLDTRPHLLLGKFKNASGRIGTLSEGLAHSTVHKHLRQLYVHLQSSVLSRGVALWQSVYKSQKRDWPCILHGRSQSRYWECTTVLKKKHCTFILYFEFVTLFFCPASTLCTLQKYSHMMIIILKDEYQFVCMRVWIETHWQCASFTRNGSCSTGFGVAPTTTYRSLNKALATIFFVSPHWLTWFLGNFQKKKKVGKYLFFHWEMKNASDLL